MLTTIRLYGTLGSRFGRVHRLAVDNAAEAVRALCTLLPGFESYMHASKDRNEGYVVFYDKQQLSEKECKGPVGKSDIRIAPVVMGAKNGGWTNIIIGAVLIVIGIIGEIYGGWGTPFIQAGIGMIAGGLVQLLTPVPKGSSSQDRAANKPSYAFNGALNTQAQGNPVPVLYGDLIVGSAVISAGIDADDQAYAPDGSIKLGYGGGGGGGSTSWNNDWKVS